jgi:hypothetical protein
MLRGWLILAALCAGCARPSAVALERGVLAYDNAVVTTNSRLLLLNIARAHRSLPLHFTAVSSIAATYDLRFNAGIGPAATGELGWLPMPTIGGSVGETPTLTIVPMQGNEFSERLLRPFDETKVGLLLSQGYDVDALLRLIAEGYQEIDPHEGPLQRNSPADRAGYAAFRRVVAHLSSAQDRNLLRVSTLQLTLRRTIPAALMDAEQLRSLSADPSLRVDTERQVYEYDAVVTGRAFVSNYDQDELSQEERVQLYRHMARLPNSAILVDLRAGRRGGEVPLHGAVHMRSFQRVLEFVGRGIAAEREYDVSPDARTPAIRDNPRSALAIVEANSPPSDGSLSVPLGDRHYALAPDPAYPWNRRTFAILYQLFQMTVAELRAPAPLIAVGN